MSNSLGASRGMAILWKRDFLNLSYNFSSPGYVGVNGMWKGGVYNFVNVYAPCSATTRRQLWRSLVDRKLRRGIEDWCL